MARTPHLRTDLSAREVATAVREAADLIDTLNEDLRNSNSLLTHKDSLIREQAEMIHDLRSRLRGSQDDWAQQETENNALTEQILQQARTIERYQRKYPEGV